MDKIGRIRRLHVAHYFRVAVTGSSGQDVHPPQPTITAALPP